MKSSITGDVDAKVIALDKLIEFALRFGLKLDFVHLNWEELKGAVSAGPTLLILRNRNVVAAFEDDINSNDQLVVFDPLYCHDRNFYLPRDVLQSAWDGDALVVYQTPVSEKRWVASFVAALAACAAMAMVLLFPRDIGKEVFAVPPAQQGNTFSRASSDIRANSLKSEMEMVITPGLSNSAVASTPVLTSALSAFEPEPNELKQSAAPDLAMPGPNLDTPPVVSTPTISNVSITEPEPDSLKIPAAPDSNSAEAPAERKQISSAEINSLVAHGDALFSTGDLTSARLLYERAADAGYGPAALRLGESYDPIFLASNRIAIRGDAAKAASWYRRARELGVAEAETLLNALPP
jgi:hypothetical protein